MGPKEGPQTVQNRRLRVIRGLPFSASMLEGLGRPIWERCGPSRGALWGPSWAPLGPTLGHLGPMWGFLGAIFGSFGGQLGSFRALVEELWGYRRPFVPMMPTAERNDDDYDCGCHCVYDDRDKYDD